MTKFPPPTYSPSLFCGKFHPFHFLAGYICIRKSAELSQKKTTKKSKRNRKTRKNLKKTKNIYIFLVGASRKCQYVIKEESTWFFLLRRKKAEAKLHDLVAISIAQEIKEAYGILRKWIGFTVS